MRNIGSNTNDESTDEREDGGVGLGVWVVWGTDRAEPKPESIPRAGGASDL